MEVRSIALILMLEGQNGYPRSERIKTLKWHILFAKHKVRMDTRVQSGLRLIVYTVLLNTILNVRMDTRVQSGLRLFGCIIGRDKLTSQNGYPRSERIKTV